MIKDELGLKSYVKHIIPKLADTQKCKRYSFGIWERKNVRKSTTRKFLLLDEKRFDIVFIAVRMTEYYIFQIIKKLIHRVMFVQSQNILKV